MDKNDKKKITIKDLCPEEKGKIGELLKKLAKEKEEKENLLKTVEEEKRKAEHMESILKEKENSLYNNSVLMNSNSQFNSSFNFNLKPESFAESYIPTNNTEKDKTIDSLNKQPSKNITIDDIKNLRSRFDKVYQKLKKTADTQDNYLNRVASEEKNKFGLNNLSIKRLEESPINLQNEKEKEAKNNYDLIHSQKTKTELYKISLDNLKEEESLSNLKSNDNLIERTNLLSNLNVKQIKVNEKSYHKQIDSNSLENFSHESNSRIDSNKKVIPNDNESDRKVCKANQLRKDLDNLFNDQTSIEVNVDKNSPNNKNNIKNNLDEIPKNKLKNLSNSFKNINFNNKYRNILNRVRENSQDEAKKMSTFNSEIKSTKNIKKMSIYENFQESPSQNNTSDMNIQNYESKDQHFIKIEQNTNYVNFGNEGEKILKNDSNNFKQQINNQSNNEIDLLGEETKKIKNKGGIQSSQNIKNFNQTISDSSYENDYHQEQNKNDKTEYYYYNYDFKKKKNNKISNSDKSNNSLQEKINNNSIKNHKTKKDDSDNKFFNQSINRILENSNFYDEEDIEPLNNSINSNFSISKLSFNIRPCTSKGKDIDKIKKFKLSESDEDTNYSRINMNKFARNRQDNFLGEMDENNNSNKNYQLNYNEKKKFLKNNKFEIENINETYDEHSENCNSKFIMKNICDPNLDKNLESELIFFLNAKNSKYSKSKNDFRIGDGIENNYNNNPSLNKRVEFYDNNLFDLIDDIEKKENKITNIQRVGNVLGKENSSYRYQNVKNYFSSIDKEKKINDYMNELESEIDKVIPHNNNFSLKNQFIRDFKYK